MNNQPNDPYDDPDDYGSGGGAIVAVFGFYALIGMAWCAHQAYQLIASFF